jgi:hypothetical protein
MTFTRQTAFDTALAHLRKQGQRAVEDQHSDAGCVYRSPEGLKCAIGALISDEDYNPNMEQLTACHQTVSKAISGLSRDTDFLSDLQSSLHDSFVPQGRKSYPEFLEAEAILFAQRWNLKL